MRQRRILTLQLAALMAAAAALTGIGAYHVAFARARDHAALHGFLGLDRPRLEPVLNVIAHLADPVPFVVMATGLVAVALVRGRRRLAVAVPAVLIASGATTQALKQITASPRHDSWLGWDQVAPASWPSGHSTAAMALALCAVMVAPPAHRAVVAAAGGVFASAVAFSLLALGWHYPSDVFGGFLVAAFYALLAVAALGGLERGPIDVRPAVGVGVAAAALVLLVAVVRPHDVVAYAERHTTFVAGAALIAALAAALAMLLALAPRQRPAST